MSDARRDLVVLAADGTMVAVLRALFRRPLDQMFACRAIEVDPQAEILHDALYTDGGVHRYAHKLLAPYVDTHGHCLVVLDQQFGGERPAAQVRREIIGNLETFGWRGRAEVVVIDPELEVWLWQDNPNVERAVRHRGPRNLRAQLRDEGAWPEGSPKPTDPKATLQRLIKQNKAGAVVVAYTLIAARVSTRQCRDAAFAHLRGALERWFPPEGA